MQSFRERSGFHGNQHCYQQDPHESSRLESYRHHHSHGHSGRGYEAHTLTAASVATAGAGSKDCYSLQAYPIYSGGESAPAKKQYKEGKVSAQHMQSSYTNHALGPAYPAQYLSEGHLQQKWAESPHLPQYEQEATGTVAPGASGGSQYLEPNMLAIPQSQCPHTAQPSTPVYTGGHHQRHPSRNSSPSPVIHAQGRLHFPQHPQPLSSPAQSYMDKCTPMPHCYKGYPMPPGSQYSRQMASSGANNLKPSTYRSQNSYNYPQPPSRVGYEQMSTMQGIPASQDSLSKYQHFGQPQQSYCLSDVSVRSPEQYYQNCSPSSGHSPARSMGRSPSYSSTPSPLMVSSETFQYSQQPAMASGGPSSSSASSSTGLQEQLLMPPHSHASPGVGHQGAGYSGTLKERFSEKLLSNPSLWSLNALTSQVENIPSNVQQLLLSEAMVGNKKGGKRGGMKKGEDFKGQPQMHEDTSCPEVQNSVPLPEAYGTPQPILAELQEAGYSSSSDEQLERSYYYCGQNRSPAQAPANTQHTLDGMPSCTLTSPDSMSTKSEDSATGLQSGQPGDSVGSVPGLQSALPGEHLNSVSRLQSAQTREDINISMKNIGEAEPANSVAIPSPVRPQQGSPADIQGLRVSLKENFEESAWSLVEGKETMKDNLTADHGGRTKVTEEHEQQGNWPADEKCTSLFHKVDKVLMEKNYPTDMEENIYRALQNQCYSDDPGSAEKSTHPSDFSHERETGSSAKLETHKSEFHDDYNATSKPETFVWRDDLEENRYLPLKADNPGHPQFSSGVDQLEEKQLSKVESEKWETPKEQCCALADPATEAKQEDSSPSVEDAVNHRTQSRELGEIHSPAKEQGDKPSTNTDAAGTELAAAERRLAVPDVATPLFPTEKIFSTMAEKAMPPTQARSHLDRRDAEVLEPDSPQLPGKSVLHPAPSWADTPPSPKKGDDDIEPGISCPSAVTPSPSAKLEPIGPSAYLGVFQRKHTRGRRGRPARPMHMGVRIRGLAGGEEKGDTATIASSKSTLFPEEIEASHKDISSQTPKLSAEGFPSRMCTRSFTAQAAPKPCPYLKRRPGPKPSEGFPTKDPPDNPKGLITKIKWMKQRGFMQDAVGHTKGRRGPSATTPQDENQDTPPLPPPSPIKDQKSMVLRSRKQAEEIPPKEKEKEKRTVCSPPKKLKEMKKQKVASMKDQDGVGPKPNLTASLQKGVCKTAICKPDETITPINKRKSSFPSPVPLKKQRGVKGGKLETEKTPVETKVTVVRGPKKKLKRGEHLTASLGCFPTKDPPLPASDIADLSCTPPQCPTKTKYLPPRKGRGLKYEAMVQKITSPGSKKQVLNPQVDTPGDLVSKATATQVVEEKEMVKAAEVKVEDTKDSQSAAVKEEEACVKAATVRRRRGRPAGSGDRHEVAPPEATSLVINTPRLAKQRAIKNNREMHMKQRRKRRKGPSLPEGTATNEQQDLPPASLPPPISTPPPEPVPPPTSSPPPTSALPLVSAPPTCTEEPVGGVQATTITSICKRGRRRLPLTKKRRGKPCSKQSSTKPNTLTRGPKRKNRDNLDAVMTLEKVHKLKVRHKKQCSAAVEQRGPVLPLNHVSSKPPENESKPSFRPYVRIDSSEELPSLCTIVNRPEEELLLHEERKKSVAKLRNSASISKAPPNSSVMLQGPLVNASLTDRCLTCCLCQKPANYRELGDLCGPYYPEDSIPRKALSFRPKLECREDGEETNSSTVEPSLPPKKESMKSPGRRGRPRRADKAQREGSGGRPSFREQYRKLQQFQGYDRRAGEGSDRGRGGAGLRRLQLEAEAREHWAHEACAVWTDGVVLITGKLYGLTEAARIAAETRCSKCQSVGASISCCWKGCTQIFHFVCAKDTGCLLQEDDFSLKCTKHKCKRGHRHLR
ncbi:retinoic acid-induced protein 1 isoform X2 [Megalops cyprinoides]|uniref:retinoic acid-induced protein 1 isoform X2 n=1 Tax=Megalops cyprinoides TaxID=118141 RepID=UPI001863A872|nr:retinoic acid-induced protein 1 isoform X2 [Megalops cyprinoides]